MSVGKKEILLGDCLELMKDIPNGSIDMILCDLPYGTTERNKWDCIIPYEKLWEQYTRVVKDSGAICLFSQLPFDKTLACSNIEMLRYEWIWKKQQGTGHLNAKKMPMKNHENILVFYKKLPTYNPQFTKGKPYQCKSGKGSSNYREQVSVVTENNGIRYPLSVIEFKSDKGQHPTQKPVALCEYLIKTYTNENDLILDNTAGSGTTAIACLNTNRQFIVMEKEQKYYDIILKRVADFNKNFEQQ